MAKHIDELQEAQGDLNPFKFKQAFDAFKVFVVNHWTQIDYDLDSKTRKQIEEVFDIENSPRYNFYYFISENLDYFFRYFYLKTYILYLCICLSSLYNFIWLYIVAIVLYVVSMFFYMFIHVHKHKQKVDWSYRKTWGYYMKMGCIFPKETVLKTNDEFDKKKKGKK